INPYLLEVKDSAKASSTPSFILSYSSAQYISMSAPSPWLPSPDVLINKFDVPIALVDTLLSFLFSLLCSCGLAISTGSILVLEKSSICCLVGNVYMIFTLSCVSANHKASVTAISDSPNCLDFCITLLGWVSFNSSCCQGLFAKGL